MHSKLIALATAVALALGLGAAAAPAAPPTAAITINHQLRGCHVWTLNGGPARTHLTVRLVRAGSLMVTNDDLMAQELVKTRGPAVVMKLVRDSHMGDMPMRMKMGQAGPYTMAHMGATLRVTFPRAGTYRFRLVDRGDYFEGIKVVGEDNELTLTVVVA